MAFAAMTSRAARLRRSAWAALRIVLLGVGSAVTYGVLQDQVTAHVCIEYFTVGHVDYLNLGDPALVAIEWGVIATWWAGLLLGLPVALVARAGRRPPVAAGDLLRPTLVVMGSIAAVAAAAGIAGFIAARSGDIALDQSLADQVPRAKHAAFLADLWAHEAAYTAGLLGGVALCIWTWRRRTTLARTTLARTTAAEVGGARTTDGPALSTVPRRWEVVLLRLFTVVGACGLALGILFVLLIALLSSLSGL